MILLVTDHYRLTCVSDKKRQFPCQKTQIFLSNLSIFFCNNDTRINYDLSITIFTPTFFTCSISKFLQTRQKCKKKLKNIYPKKRSEIIFEKHAKKMQNKVAGVYQEYMIFSNFCIFSGFSRML